MKRRFLQIGSGVIFFSSFYLYMHTMGPTLVPYRDAGEMATTVTHLGILHPPGYPLYSLVGHLWTRLPLANPAYRLNLLSATSLALAWGILFLLGAEWWGVATAALTVLLGAVSFQFWMHALVSEMYTLNLLILSALLWLLYHRKFDAAALLFGLGLGARMDLLLCAPALGFLFFGQTRSDEQPQRLGRWVLFFFLGSSVFLFLWVRANASPLQNWGDPSTLERLFASIIRRSYGGTLDLLSKSYRAGENFWPQFQLYLKHLARDFTLLSYPLAVIGWIHLWKKERLWFWTVLSGWMFTGPLFVFLGNLPPNPHAVAIMEAAYLVPDIFYLLAIGAGLAYVKEWFAVFPVVCSVLGLLIAAQAIRFYPAVNKRNNWIAADFIRNVFYSVPEPSLVVAHSDVPVFSLFYGYWVYPGFRWRVPIAQGLASSAWYQVMMNRQVPKLDVEALRTTEDWEAMLKANSGWSLYGTPDTEWPADLYPRMVSSGLVWQFLPRGKASITASDTRLREFGIYRGRYRYDAYYEFFSPELIEEYAKAWMEWGRLLMRSHQEEAAIQAYLQALVLKPDMPYPAFQLGFIYFQRNEFSQADAYYHWCIDNFRKMDRDTQEWKTFADQRGSILRDEAQAMAHWGVIRERLGSPERAEKLYYQALKVDPECADARYNLAVIYWRSQRWADVVEQLQALAAAHPNDQRWRAYLPQALERLKAGS